MRMQIPFHRPYITKSEIDAVKDTLKSGWLTMGPKTIEFEEEFRKYIGCKNTVALNSCTAALHLALEAIGLRQGDEVITSPFTFAATGEAICYFKARPVFVDIERDTCNINVNKIEEKITKKTRAIIPVHYGGQPCDMDEILEIARRYNLFVIEDAAHALPSFYEGKKIGTIGDITCFSFYATKPLATGEGGMLCTDNEEWAERIRCMRLHGIGKDAWRRYSKEGSWYYEVSMLGYKYNMTDIQAALGIEQLKKLDFMYKKRKRIAKRYTEAFKDIKEIITPSIKGNGDTSWHLYSIKLRTKGIRNSFIEGLKEKGIGTSVHFIPLYRFPFYKESFRYDPSDFPDCEWVYERAVSLPIYPGMTDKEVEYVIENIMDVVKSVLQ